MNIETGLFINIKVEKNGKSSYPLDASSKLVSTSSTLSTFSTSRVFVSKNVYDASKSGICYLAVIILKYWKTYLNSVNSVKYLIKCQVY